MQYVFSSLIHPITIYTLDSVINPLNKGGGRYLSEFFIFENRTNSAVSSNAFFSRPVALIMRNKQNMTQVRNRAIDRW